MKNLALGWAFNRNYLNFHPHTKLWGGNHVHLVDKKWKLRLGNLPSVRPGWSWDSSLDLPGTQSPTPKHWVQSSWAHPALSLVSALWCTHILSPHSHLLMTSVSCLFPPTPGWECPEGRDSIWFTMSSPTPAIPVAWKSPVEFYWLREWGLTPSREQGWTRDWFPAKWLLCYEVSSGRFGVYPLALFIQQISIVCLLCVRHYFSCWRYSGEQSRQKKSPPLGSWHSRGAGKCFLQALCPGFQSPFLSLFFLKGGAFNRCSLSNVLVSSKSYISYAYHSG